MASSRFFSSMVILGYGETKSLRALERFYTLPTNKEATFSIENLNPFLNDIHVVLPRNPVIRSMKRSKSERLFLKIPYTISSSTFA